MKAYDFDKTIYDGDSSVDFYLFEIKRHPGLVASAFPTAFHAVRFKLGRLSTKEFKQGVFGRFLPKIDLEEELAAFWATHAGKIKGWYLQQKEEEDVIVSASPAFLLEPICKRLGVRLIATDMDPATGAINGPNMHDVAKVDAFTAQYPDVIPEAFYSDSASDVPMMKLASKAFLVKGDSVSPIDPHRL